jgi:hypothetical protein
MPKYFYLSRFSGKHQKLPPCHKNGYIHGHYILPLHGKSLSAMNDQQENVETTPPFLSSNDEVEKNNMR